MKYDQMTLDQLNALMEDLDQERLQLRQRAFQVRDARDRLLSDEQAAAKLGLHRLKPHEIERASRLLAQHAKAGVAEKDLDLSVAAQADHN